MDYIINLIFLAFLLYLCYDIYSAYFKIKRNSVDIMGVYIDQELTKRYTRPRVP